MASNNPRRNPPQAPTESAGVPDWAWTIHPREIAFYSHRLEALSTANQAISAIARVLANAQRHEETQEKLDWLGGNIRCGLSLAIEVLTDQAAGHIEFMQERAAQYRPPER